MRQWLRLSLISCTALAASAGVVAPAAAQTNGFGGSVLPTDKFVEPKAQATPAEPRAKSAPAKARAAAKPASRSAPLRETALSSDTRVSFAPDTALLTQLAAERYLGIAQSGGWASLPNGVTLKIGDTGGTVSALKHQLALTGDLPAEAEDGAVFDARVAAAVKRFQMRHGLRQSGVVSGRTLSELNVPAMTRHRQLSASARRLGGSQFGFGPRYVVVNIPSASVEAIEDGVVKKRYVAVVGKPERASPTVETRITSVNLNPTWTVPTTLIKKDIIPHMQKDSGYLAKQKIRILNIHGEEIDPQRINWSTERATAFTLRQDPGAHNSLGQIKIDMPNKLAVYMHDTPSKSLFSRDERFHSSGCVRVQNIRDFAAWLLEGSGGPAPEGAAAATGWDRAAIDTGITAKTRKDIRLKAPVPVAWVYLTGYATEDGTVHFRPDVYGLDTATTEATPVALAR